METMRKLVVSEHREKVAEEVRALMGRHRVSQKALGIALGLGQSGISDRVNGKVPFDVDELYAMAEFFDVPVVTFFGSSFLSGYVTAVPDPEGPLQLSLDDALDAAKLPSPTLCLI